MIKTLKDDECRFLRRILPHYVRHMTVNTCSVKRPTVIYESNCLAPNPPVALIMGVNGNLCNKRELALTLLLTNLGETMQQAYDPLFWFELLIRGN